MAAYRRVYDSRHLQADCQEPGSAPEPLRSVIEYGLPVPFLLGNCYILKLPKSDCSPKNKPTVVVLLYIIIFGTFSFSRA